MTAQSAVALVRPETGELVSLDDWTETRKQFVIQNYCGGAPENVAAAFIQLAQKRRLSPEEKQIYLIDRGGKWSPETSIDGYRLIADRTERYAGSDVPIFGETIDGHPDSASVTVYKIVQGHRVPFSAVAYWDEFVPEKPTMRFMWNRMPRQMLAKCAEAQALRKAFPADLSGIYVSEEMQQAEDEMRTATVRDVTPRSPKPKAIAPPPDDPRGLAAKHLFATIREVYGKAQPISDIGHDLVCTRYGLQSTKEATEEQLRAVADAVKAWSYEDAVKAWEHIRLIAGAETETMLVDCGMHFEEIHVSSPFVLQALSEQLRRVEEKRTTTAPSMAETDALVAAATVGVDGP